MRRCTDAATAGISIGAVTRAGRRIYIVGDHDLWSALPYFQEAAGRLEKTSASALSDFELY